MFTVDYLVVVKVAVFNPIGIAVAVGVGVAIGQEAVVIQVGFGGTCIVQAVAVGVLTSSKVGVEGIVNAVAVLVAAAGFNQAGFRLSDKVSPSLSVS